MLVIPTTQAVETGESWPKAGLGETLFKKTQNLKVKGLGVR
jgi:hypothetical protein